MTDSHIWACAHGHTIDPVCALKCTRGCPTCRDTSGWVRALYLEQLRKDCVVDCDFGCGGSLPFLALTEHERARCPKRPYPCPFAAAPSDDAPYQRCHEECSTPEDLWRHFVCAHGLERMSSLPSPSPSPSSHDGRQPSHLLAPPLPAGDEYASAASTLALGAATPPPATMTLARMQAGTTALPPSAASVGCGGDSKWLADAIDGVSSLGSSSSFAASHSPAACSSEPASGRAAGTLGGRKRKRPRCDDEFFSAQLDISNLLLHGRDSVGQIYQLGGDDEARAGGPPPQLVYACSKIIHVDGDDAEPGSAASSASEDADQPGAAAQQPLVEHSIFPLVLSDRDGARCWLSVHVGDQSVERSTEFQSIRKLHKLVDHKDHLSVVAPFSAGAPPPELHVRVSATPPSTAA